MLFRFIRILYVSVAVVAAVGGGAAADVVDVDVGKYRLGMCDEEVGFDDDIGAADAVDGCCCSCL